MNSKKGNGYIRSYYINGEMLKAIMRFRKITQEQLANKIGVHKNSINNAVTKNRIDKESKIYEIAETLNVNVDFLTMQEIPYVHKIIDNDKIIEVTEIIDASNFAKFIDDFPFRKNAEMFWSTEDVNNFFKPNEKSNSIEFEDQIDLYNDIVVDFRDTLIDTFIKLKDSNKKNPAEYIKKNFDRIFKDKFK